VQAASTKTWARIFGLWTLLAVAGMVANRQNTVFVVDGFFTNATLMWSVGVFTSLVGIAAVVTHHRLTGGPVAVVVTLYGWLVLVKGLMFLWLPAPVEQAFYHSLQFGRYFYLYFIVALAFGAYLTYGGFKSA